MAGTQVEPARPSAADSCDIVTAASPLPKMLGTVNRVLPDSVKAAGSGVLSVPLGR